MIHADHLNTPRVITDNTGTPVWLWRNQNAFGDNTPNEDPDGDSNLFEYNLRFAGQYFDTETGLHYNYFRDYEPATGRYLSSDPIGLAGGLNTFGYVSGNPLTYVDPKGLSAVAGAGVGAVLICARYPKACTAGAIALCRLFGGCEVPNGMMNEEASEEDEPECPPKGRIKNPPDYGPPNGYIEGPRRGREYNPDGTPLRDYDKPHQGANYPHVHEWPNGEREEPGRPYSPIPPKE